MSDSPATAPDATGMTKSAADRLLPTFHSSAMRAPTKKDRLLVKGTTHDNPIPMAEGKKGFILLVRRRHPEQEQFQEARRPEVQCARDRERSLYHVKGPGNRFPHIYRGRVVRIQNLLIGNHQVPSRNYRRSTKKESDELSDKLPASIGSQQVSAFQVRQQIS